MIKILVPVDFSATSSKALFYAIELFQAAALEITLLHVYSSNPTTMALKDIDHVIEKDSKRTMNKIVEKVEKAYPDISVKSKVIRDHAVSAITSLGNSGAYDFVVMGTKGASGLKEVFLGSISGGVISKTMAPVVVVPAGYSFRPLKEIVLALSNTPFSDDKILDPLRKLAAVHKSRIKVLHFSEEQTHLIEKALADIQDLNPSIEYAFGTGDTNKDLSEYLSINESGMLCLIRGHKGFFERLFKGSVTLKQTFESPVPLLILHDIV